MDHNQKTAEPAAAFPGVRMSAREAREVFGSVTTKPPLPESLHLPTQASNVRWIEVTDSLMDPRFKKGEAVEVDLGLPIEENRDAVLIRYGAKNMTCVRVVSIHDDRLVVKQFNRDSAVEFEIWRENIEAAYRITGTYVSYHDLRERQQQPMGTPS